VFGGALARLDGEGEDGIQPALAAPEEASTVALIENGQYDNADTNAAEY